MCESFVSEGLLTHGTAKSEEIVSKDMWGGGIPLYVPLWMCGSSFSEGLSLIQLSQQ